MNNKNIKNKSNDVVGIIDMTSTGNAYLISEKLDYDVFIPYKNMNYALDKDKVSASIIKKNRKVIAKVISIIKRNTEEFVVCFDKNVKRINNYYSLNIKHKGGYLNCFIYDYDINDINNKKVLVRIVKWNKDKVFAKVKSVVGDIGDLDTDINEILLNNSVSINFDKYLEDKANEIRFNITKKDLNNRKDMRNISTFTIDPIDAKDFDDAISVNKISDDNIQIGVHIADVTHYIKEDSLLDIEALNRSVSIYLPNRVIPMLPESISNNICSINPNEDKFAFSFVFNFDKKANIKSKWIGKTIIRSNNRLNYYQTQQIIDGEENIDIREYVMTANKIAKKLRNIRREKGFININGECIKFKFDESGNPVSIFKNKIYESNKMIEEFMILANKEVSEFISLKNGKQTNKVFLYRVHEKPNRDKLNNLKNTMKKLNYKININSKEKFINSANRVLKNIDDKVKLNMVERIILSHMSKAKYSVESLGHYALSFNYYTHFTSPIRRYSDILSHRFLYSYLNNDKIKPKPYKKICNHISKMERLAIDIERETIKYMRIRYIKNYLNKDFYGIISHINDYGFFVELENDIGDGFIKTNIKRKGYNFRRIDEQSYINISNKKKYSLFDKIRVKLVNVDLNEKKIDLKLL